MKYLKNNKGMSYILAVVLILVVFIMLSFLLEYLTITASTKQIKNALENAVVSVSLDNSPYTYSSQREGYTGAYTKENGSWAVKISNGDVYAKLKDNLHLTQNGGSYIKYSGQRVDFILSNLNVQAIGAEFLSAGDTTKMFQAKISIDVEIPVMFLGNKITSIKTTVDCKSKYTYKF